jgi:hypothetical protein
MAKPFPGLAPRGEWAQDTRLCPTLPAQPRLSKLGIEPISERVTPHSLRRTFASLRAACGDDPVYIAEQLGHEDPAFTIRVYAKVAKRRERLSGAYLAAFDGALEWAHNGHRTVSGDDPRSAPVPKRAEDPAY